jgi:glycine oxidase
VTPAATDVLLIGGGVIGLSTAWQLSKRGARVTVVERQTTGREASWAGAGILPPGVLARAVTAESRLRALSHSLWPDWSHELRRCTGIDNGFDICGSLHVELTRDAGSASGQLAAWRAEGVTAIELDRSGLEHCVAGLNEGITRGVLLPGAAQVRNPRHLQALRAACLQHGVEIVEHAKGLRLETSGPRVVAALVSGRRLTLDRVAVTAGAWSAQILEQLGVVIPVHPVRGQIVQLRLPARPFRCLIEDGRRYVVPRQDGLVLAGSTEERVGFVRQTTAEGVSGLLEFATNLVPALADAEIVTSWAGLRPATPDELPVIDRIGDYDNAFVAAGHFRSGLQMSPGTAVVLTDLMLGDPPAIPVDGLSRDRFDSSVRSPG